MKTRFSFQFLSQQPIEILQSRGIIGHHRLFGKTATYHITDFQFSRARRRRRGGGDGVPLFLKLTETVFHSYTLRLIIPDPLCRIWARRLRIQAHLFFELTWESPHTETAETDKRRLKTAAFFYRQTENEKRGTFSTSLRFMGDENALKSPIPSHKGHWRWLYL